MFKKIFGMFSNDIAIDLGTANTLIYVRDKGIVLDEPSVVAVRRDANGALLDIADVGHNAKAMLGKTPKNLFASRPLKDGVISNYLLTEKMLQAFIKKIHKPTYFFRPSPRVLVCVPAQSTQVERRAIKEAALGAGAREVYLIEEPMAAALGAGLPVSSPKGSFIVDIGGGTTEVAVLSLDGIECAVSERVGGDQIDEAIISHIRTKFGLKIGEHTAERIKHEVGSAIRLTDEENKTIVIQGFNINEDLPREATISSNDVVDAITDPLEKIVRAVQSTIQKTKPELAADIYKNGITLSGGGALLRNIDKLISEKTGIGCYIADEPLTCVARGGGKALEKIIRDGYDSFTTDEIPQN
ncbi:rod shape-determining protein [Psittacicella hinzii]|uniref:Cell shape-determining protein MreB n=1 Tax=Psittacicella hinzii TaxID=2028575 RepID=A0A3A1YCX6_9GAMM|nr:rod shape-determining protein [Psittacicella hinzii]RIY35038.1 rod shape-determining protein [Psittacicella hinzii]